MPIERSPSRRGAVSDDRERVRDANPIEDVVSEHVKLIPAGRSLKGLCPFHREKTPSFHVDPERGTYRCFGCQANGDVFSFVMGMESLDFREALEQLAERANITLERRGGGSTLPASSKKPDYELLARVSIWFQNQLKSPAAGEARAYLAERGLGGDVAQRFALGFAPDEWDALTNQLTTSGQVDRALQLGVLRRNDEKKRTYDMFRGRIMFPIRDAQGRTVGFGGRCLPSASHADGSAPPKYINSTESEIFQKGKLLFGHFEGRDSIRRARTLVVMEGYTDVMAAHREGFDTCVASLGTAFTESNVANLRRLADRVVFVFDGDDAGRRAARKAVELTIAERLDIGVVLLEDGADPADLLSEENGRETFRRPVPGPRTALDFLVDDCATQHLIDRSNPAHSSLFARSLCDAIQPVTDELTRRRACELVAERLEVPVSLIVGEFEKWNRASSRGAASGPGSRRTSHDAGPRNSGSGHSGSDHSELANGRSEKHSMSGPPVRHRETPTETRASRGRGASRARPSVEERNVLRACIEWPEHLLRLLALREPHEFTDPRCRTLADAMEETARPFRSLELEDLDLRNLAIAIEESDPPDPEWLRRWLHGNVVHRANRNADHLKRARELHGVFDAPTRRQSYDQLVTEEMEIRSKADRVRCRTDLDLNSLLDEADDQIRVAEELRERFDLDAPSVGVEGEPLPIEPDLGEPPSASFEGDWK